MLVAVKALAGIALAAIQAAMKCDDSIHSSMSIEDLLENPLAAVRAPFADIALTSVTVRSINFG